MRVAIDARAATEEPGGRGRYVRELLIALATRDDRDLEYLLLARTRWEGLAADDRFSWRLIASPDPVWHLRAALAANRSADVMLSTNSYLTAWFTRIPTAVVVYDLITFRPELLPQRRASVIERATAPHGVRRAGALICISEATELDLVQRFPAARGRTAVTPLAADQRFATAVASDPAGTLLRLGIAQPYVLATGTLEPRKNLERLIAACEGRDLVLVGATGWDADGILAAADTHRDRVKRLGHVSDHDLVALYRGAEVFCYPSPYEGFGLPVLEAMACGTPVVTSNLSSLPEVTGDAAVLVDPLDVRAIRDGLARAVQDAPRLRAEGPRRAALFSWERTARETVATLRTLAPQSG